MAQLIVYNPLPVAYAHREKQLVAVLGDGVEFVRTENEGYTGVSRILALLRHLRAAIGLRRSTTPVLVTWPLLGWFEILLWSSPHSSVYLSVHDPRPLRRQVGLGRFAAWLANRVPVRRRPHIVCHSAIASETTRSILHDARILLLPLPMLPPNGTAAATSEARPRRVLVLGQYKTARDLELLSALGARLPELGLEGVIAGRGWPEIDGWQVQSRFLTEEEFDRELLLAGCLLIPYLHYFQSGVALRAVEIGTPVVGARHPFLCDSLGLESTPGIINEPESIDSWVAAINASLRPRGQQVGPFDSVRNKWLEWMAGASRATGVVGL